MGMNVINAGGTYQIYGESLKTYTKLPLGTYEINFSKMSGFFLTEHNDLEVAEKIYGSTPKKVEKVLHSFQTVKRNFGVILSGKKGIGKSLFARQLAVRAKDYNLPLIIVDTYIPGIANFISSIEQEVIIFFDEFEKTFADRDESSPQEEMLSLFDGIDSGKKLFIITCNETDKLNSYLLNRPGRFHYHFVLGNPTSEEIREYMMDKLDKQYHDAIQKVVNFSLTVDLTYDILRAIAFELNNGYSFEETIMDLNISKESSNNRYTATMTLMDGTVFTSEETKIDLYSNHRYYVWFGSHTKYSGNSDNIRIDFVGSDIKVDPITGELSIDVDKVSKFIDEDYFDLNKAEDKARYEYFDKIPIAKIVFKRNTQADFAFKYLV